VSKTEFAELSSTKIGKEVLALEIKNSHTTFQTRLDETINKIEVKLLSINKRIKELKKQTSIISNKQASIQKAVSARKPIIQPQTETRIKSKPAPAFKPVPATNQKATPSSPPPPASIPATQKQGTIVEQDIKE
jgi:hypothetical protein